MLSGVKRALVCVCAEQADRRSLVPVWPRIRTNSSADRADHARAERWQAKPAHSDSAVAIEIQTTRKRQAIKANARPNMNASEILIAFQPHEVLGVQIIAMCLVPFDHQKWQRLVNCFVCNLPG